MKKTLLTTSLFLAIAFAKSQTPVVHYTFDNLSETTGLFTDLVTYGSGIPTAFVAPGATTSVYDTCVQFTSGQGFVTPGALNNSTWTGTAISFWYKSTSYNTGYIVQGAYLGFGVYATSTGVANVFFDGSYSGAYGSVAIIANGFWHHIVAQNNGTTTEIFVDGVLKRSGAETLYKLPSANSNAKLYFGNSLVNNAGDQPNGQLDEFKIFNHALTQSEITTLYQYKNSTTSVSENNFTKNMVTIYPNPVKDYLTINSSEKINKASIYTINGSLVEILNTIDNKIDVSNLSKGMYIMVVQSDKGISQHKFIKE